MFPLEIPDSIPRYFPIEKPSLERWIAKSNLLRRRTDNVEEDKQVSAPRLCSLTPPVTEDSVALSSLGSTRMTAILLKPKKWINVTELTFAFYPATTTFTGGLKNYRTHALVDGVRKAFAIWMAVNVGMTFRELDEGEVHKAQIRIGFAFGDPLGTYSKVGTDAELVVKTERTMNFSWDFLDTTVDTRGLSTPVHEIGHSLGLKHEHQSPKGGIVWNEANVKAEYSATMTLDQIKHNWFEKLDLADVEGSVYDSSSVMHYEISPGLVIEPAKFVQTGINPFELRGRQPMSDVDKTTIKKLYPPASDHEMPPSVAKTTKLAVREVVVLSTGSNDFLLETKSSNERRSFCVLGQCDSMTAVADGKGRHVHHSTIWGTSDYSKSFWVQFKDAGLHRVHIFVMWKDGDAGFLVF